MSGNGWKRSERSFPSPSTSPPPPSPPALPRRARCVGTTLLAHLTEAGEARRRRHVRLTTPPANRRASEHHANAVRACGTAGVPRQYSWGRTITNRMGVCRRANRQAPRGRARHGAGHQQGEGARAHSRTFYEGRAARRARCGQDQAGGAAHPVWPQDLCAAARLGARAAARAGACVHSCIGACIRAYTHWRTGCIGAYTRAAVHAVHSCVH